MAKQFIEGGKDFDLKSKYCEKNLYTQPIIDSVSNACLNTH
jgi:hypothetical protein